MIIIVGLGNPGKEYERTRHNAGFLTLEALRKEFQFPTFLLQEKWKAEISKGKFDEQELLLVKPHTFMNKSGEAIQKLVGFYKIPLSHLWLIYDDIDLPLGEIRIRKKGSAGTHNGMRSAIQALNSENFPRFRLGIGEGSTGFRKGDLSDWILSKIPQNDWSIVQKMTKKAALAICFALQEGIEATMNKGYSQPQIREK